MRRPDAGVVSDQAGELLRFLLWRILGLIALVAAIALTGWLLDGGLGATLRGVDGSHQAHLTVGSLSGALDSSIASVWGWAR
ncbi:MAG TPA: hypothetical protein VK733_03520, partial [Gemmatimonadaceae bacterium]|nr:hypothetical protein [Gemmatimonadaceae bacterium]